MTFSEMPDLASRALGGSVVHATDEHFAERENLINATEPTHDPAAFGHKGKVYDGWETRRRRTPGEDSAVIRLGVPGVVNGVVVDTAFFRGNYPPQVSVDAACVDGYPSVEEVLAADWQPLVPRTDVKGDSRNELDVTDPEVRGRRWTHVRLTMHPDGGVARLRVHGEVVPDPRLLAAGPVDLAAVEVGGRVVGCSDGFYGSPARLLLPGLTRSMGEGWETARRRDGGNDWVVVRLGCEGVVDLAELDTTWYVGNAPGEAALSGCAVAAGTDPPQDPAAWAPVLPRTRLQPDTRHRFVLGDGPAVTHVRLDAFPDGGMARLRLYGRPTEDALARAWDRWRATGPDA